MTTCHHVFCYQCVSEYLTGDDNMCPEPKCKEQLHPDAVYTKSTLKNCISDGNDDSSSSSRPFGKSSVMQHDYTSAKIKAVLEILQTKCLANAPTPQHENNPVGLKGDSFQEYIFAEGSHSSVNVMKHTTVYSNQPIEGPLKAIIFSQWTGMLNLVESSLNDFCIEYRRLDGTMSLAARDRAVKDFNTDPSVCLNFFFHSFFQVFLDFLVADWNSVGTSLADNCDVDVAKSRKPWFEYGGCMSCNIVGFVVESNY